MEFAVLGVVGVIVMPLVVVVILGMVFGMIVIVVMPFPGVLFVVMLFVIPLHMRVIVVMIAAMQMRQNFRQATARDLWQGHHVFGQQHGADGSLDGVLVLGRCRRVFEAHDVHAGCVDVDSDHAVFDSDFRLGHAMHMGLHFTAVLRNGRKGKGRGGKRQEDRFHGRSFRR